MANKREITIVITRWEAQALVWAHECLLDANGGHPDWRAFDRAVNKIEAQLRPPESERKK